MPLRVTPILLPIGWLCCCNGNVRDATEDGERADRKSADYWFRLGPYSQPCPSGTFSFRPPPPRKVMPSGARAHNLSGSRRPVDSSALIPTFSLGDFLSPLIFPSKRRYSLASDRTSGAGNSQTSLRMESHLPLGCPWFHPPFRSSELGWILLACYFWISLRN